MAVMKLSIVRQILTITRLISSPIITGHCAVKSNPLHLTEKLVDVMTVMKLSIVRKIFDNRMAYIISLII